MCSTYDNLGLLNRTKAVIIRESVRSGQVYVLTLLISCLLSLMGDNKATDGVVLRSKVVIPIINVS